MINKSRALYIFKYLWDHTDEEHPATTADIIQYLASIGISTIEETIKIQQEGRAARQNAEVELAGIEERLKQTLLSAVQNR